MSAMMESVEKLTQLVGNNSMQLLMFHLGPGPERYGINVFKVQEVCRCPKLTALPYSDPAACGVATIRGKTLPVFDLAAAIGFPPLPHTENFPLVITEYNRQVIGYVVNRLDRIVHTPWSDVSSPPATIGSSSYLTAVTRVDDAFVEIIDVEKVWSEIIPVNEHAEADATVGVEKLDESLLVLVVDDSSVARRQIRRPLESLGVEVVTVNDGAKGLAQLQEWVHNDREKLARLALVISDIEMPEMDGYTLTYEIKKDPALVGFPVILHSSVTGSFNKEMVEKVGADFFLPKYDPNDLVKTVIGFLQDVSVESPLA